MRVLLLVLVIIVASPFCLSAADAGTDTAEAARQLPPVRARLLKLHGEAVELVEHAARDGVAREEVEGQLLEARRRLEALSAQSSALLPAGLRDDLRRAADELNQKADQLTEASPHFDGEPYLDLLAEVGRELDEEVTLELSFQGSYTESKVKEPAVGGHAASAMGPAPMPAAEGEAAPEQSQPPEGELRPPGRPTFCGQSAEDQDATSTDTVAATPAEDLSVTASSWIALRLETGRTALARGTQAVMTAGGSRQIREIPSASGDETPAGGRVRFDLGTYDGSVEVEVRSPGGPCWRWQGLQSGHAYVLDLSASGDRPEGTPAAR